MKARNAWLLGPAVLLALVTSQVAAAPPSPDTTRSRPNAPAAADAESEVGVFIEHCRFSHRAPDDPIVHPNEPGASHSHDFFGNVTTNASSTYASLRAGGTTCRTLQDASGYWVPTLYQNDMAVTPVSATIYYRTTGRLDPSTLQPFPPAFRVVAGNANATSPQGPTVTTWGCQGLPMEATTTPPGCPADAPLVLRVRFPSCWDDVNVDSADHKSHLAYATRRGCPADHPVLVPKLTMIVHYPISGDPGTITLSSHSVYSGHADFFNAWDQNVLTQKVKDCLRTRTRCTAGLSTSPG